MDNPTSQNLIEEAVAAIQSGQASVETCASRYGATWAEMEAPVRLALKLGQAGKSFKQELPPLDINKGWANLQANLIKAGQTAEAADSGTNPGLTQQPMASRKNPSWQVIQGGARTAPQTKAVPDWRRKPLAWVAALLLASLVAFGGSAGVAQASLPGDGLYSYKLWLDGVGQLVATSAGAKAEAALDYAEHRLEEMEKLVQQGRVQWFDIAASEYRKALDTYQQVAKEDGEISTAQNTRLSLQQERLVKTQNQLGDVGTRLGTYKSVKVEKSEQELEQLVKQIDIVKTTQATPTPAATPSPSIANPTIANPGTTTPAATTDPGSSTMVTPGVLGTQLAASSPVASTTPSITPQGSTKASTTASAVPTQTRPMSGSLADPTSSSDKPTAPSRPTPTPVSTTSEPAPVASPPPPAPVQPVPTPLADPLPRPPAPATSAAAIPLPPATPVPTLPVPPIQPPPAPPIQPPPAPPPATPAPTLPAPPIQPPPAPTLPPIQPPPVRVTIAPAPTPTIVPTKAPEPSKTPKNDPKPTKAPNDDPKPTKTPKDNPKAQPTSTPPIQPTLTPLPQLTATLVPQPTLTPLPQPTATPVPQPTATTKPTPTKKPKRCDDSPKLPLTDDADCDDD